MSDGNAGSRRVRFFGRQDLASGWYLDRVGELVEQFDASKLQTNATDVIELHNVQQYLEDGLLPHSFGADQRAQAIARIPQMRSVVGRFFSAVDDTNCPRLIVDVGFDYHADLLDLLGRHKAFQRCSAEVMLSALTDAGVRLGTLLANEKLVDAYGSEIRERLLGAPHNAEHLIRKHMQKESAREIYLPTSLTPADMRQLMESYIDSGGANPNYVGLIETAPVSRETGVDAKLKLRAKRRNLEMTQKFFEENAGFRTGCEVLIADSQDEAMKCDMDDSDGMVVRFSYSGRWLEETVDNPSILNNFQHLFGFADRQVLLTLPSYPAQLGVLERVMTTTGKTDYQTGAVFRSIDLSTLLQTRLYDHYMKSKNIDLEEVISWFFEEYLVQEFGAGNFSFAPSDRQSSYLQRVRHLFVELESVTAQFSLFVENGELDRDLHAITSDPVRYKEVPSLLDGKYLYPSSTGEIAGVLDALFSNQSTLAYINDELSAENAARLLIENEVAYGDFHEYQKPAINRLIELDVLADTGTRVRFADPERFGILKSLFTTQAVSYYHLSTAGRVEAGAMVSQGWLTRQSSLLTEDEAKYFNYFLNKVDFSNGPELRNKYLHGSQANADGEDSHFRAYLTALRLIIALVIKINDDFCLAATMFSPPPTGSPAQETSPESTRSRADPIPTAEPQAPDGSVQVSSG